MAVCVGFVSAVVDEELDDVVVAAELGVEERGIAPVAEDVRVGAGDLEEGSDEVDIAVHAGMDESRGADGVGRVRVGAWAAKGCEILNFQGSVSSAQFPTQFQSSLFGPR